MKVIYRYSDTNSQGKEKITDKLTCFKNFVSTFSSCEVTVLVDYSVKSIPGKSTHIEKAWLTPLTDWSKV